MERESAAVDLYTRYYVERGDERRELFRLLRERYRCRVGLYPGCYVHVTPSFYLPIMVYVDSDRRAHRFFRGGAARRIVGSRKVYADEPVIRFHPQDYREPLSLTEGSVDLLVSQYAGFVSETCSRYLRPGGLLVANDSHGDAGLANIDPAFELIGAIDRRGDRFSLTTDGLEEYFVRDTPAGLPRRSDLRDYLKGLGRGLRYAKPADDYLFRKQ